VRIPLFIEDTFVIFKSFFEVFREPEKWGDFVLHDDIYY
jgi:hypothetical protein